MQETSVFIEQWVFEHCKKYLIPVRQFVKYAIKRYELKEFKIDQVKISKNILKLRRTTFQKTKYSSEEIRKILKAHILTPIKILNPVTHEQIDQMWSSITKQSYIEVKNEE